MAKVLKALCIAMMALAVIFIVTGVLAMVGSPQVAEVVSAMDGELAGSAAIFSKAAGILAIFVGVLNLLVGILGYRGATGAKKSLNASIILVIVSLAITLFGMIGEPLTWQSIGNVVFPVGFLVAAIGTRRKLA